MFNYYDDENKKLMPEQRMWIRNKVTEPSYEDAEPLLYFFDKYATIVVGGARTLGKYFKQNRGKSLLDKLTVSDIAYSFLVYESAHDVWKEEVMKAKTCATADERNSFEHKAVNKYHVKRGTRLPVYQDGWTNEGQEYFKNLCREIGTLKASDKLWTGLKVHWMTYVKKYHSTFFHAQIEVDEAALEEENNNKENDEEDDCGLVSLPGENGHDEEMELNEDELEEEEEEDDDDFNDRIENILIASGGRRDKRRRAVPV
jgi:hypothetical protein